MPQLITNTFSSYAFTDAEALQASVLTGLQKMYIQNLISQAAETKLHLIFSPENAVDFAQQTAYHTGAVDILQALLANSDLAEEELAGKNNQTQL